MDCIEMIEMYTTLFYTTLFTTCSSILNVLTELTLHSHWQFWFVSS